MADDWNPDLLRTAATSPQRKRFSTNTNNGLETAAIPIARMRPGFILQRAAASGLMRYGLPEYLPMQLVPWLPLLPLDRRLCIPLIHADDVADAISRVIDKRAAGPFNLAAEPPVGRDDVAAALGAPGPFTFPSPVCSERSWISAGGHGCNTLTAAGSTWRSLCLSLALFARPPRTRLGHRERTSTDALADLLDGVAHPTTHADSPPLRQRSMLDLLTSGRDRRVDLVASATLARQQHFPDQPA